MSLLEKITIIIPTYERQRYVVRNMDYWSGKDAQVIVVDGSSNPVDSALLKRIAENVSYHHMPLSIKQRLDFAVGQLNTPYVMLCGDDEFMLPSGIIASIRHLESHQDYAQTGGRSVGFLIKDNILNLYPVKSEQKNHVVGQDDVMGRIEYHIKNYTPSTIYAVHRSNYFSSIINAANHYQYSNGGYTLELIFELLSASVGKSCILSDVMWIRSSENNPVHYTGWDRQCYLPDWYENKEYEQEVICMYNVLIDSICSCYSDIPRETVLHCLKRIIEHRIEYFDKPSINRIRNGAPVKVNVGNYFKSLLKNIIIKYSPFTQEKYISSYFRDNKKYSYHRLINQEDIKIRDVRELNDIWERILIFHNTNGSIKLSK
ncbi:TIGR00180 family glycosyltransferase [Chlorobium sp. KB01]|uniref:TIGR00180 family glycosyltransferase n=1 Tax=Chlorobium sp. KB01 TaxID=1917528 RepID=UPI000975C082|nr:TIGR00180 family glycosyltransferase [Chlorobium sp. KB01]